MAETVTFQSVRQQLKSGKPAAVYLLHGEEGFYIDALAREVEALVPESDRDFNLSTLYAPQTEPARVVELCRSYPMMADRQVVVVREVQSGGPGHITATAYLNALAAYVANPTPTTVLCLCFRGEQARGADFLKALRGSKGVNFESKKLNERTVGPVINEFISQRGLTVDPKALAMLSDFVGTDLSRLYNEIDKLTLSLGAGAMVTPEAVERNIGVSKDYNNFEFVAAIARHDEMRAFRILRYFRADPKNNPPQVLVVNLFTLFSNLLIAYYAADKSDRGLMNELGFRWPAQLTDIKQAMRFYGPWQTIEIIDLLRRFDAASKGNGSRLDPFDLLHDLTFRILNPLGQAGIRL